MPNIYYHADNLGKGTMYATAKMDVKVQDEKDIAS